MHLAKVRIVLFGMAVLSSCSAQDIQPDAVIAEYPSSCEVLTKAAETYQNLTSYRDEGVAMTRFERTVAAHTTERHFTTAYSRSGQFRFEFTEPGMVGGLSRYVVWKQGDEVKSWWSLNAKVIQHENLGTAIAGATGVSGGTAYFIPPVLMKEAAWKGITWTAPAHTYRISDGADRGVACFRIQRLTSTEAAVHGGIQTPATEGMETYWISKAEFLLLRIDSETDFGSFLTKGTIQYYPTVNSPIPDSAFEFGH